MVYYPTYKTVRTSPTKERIREVYYHPITGIQVVVLDVKYDGLKYNKITLHIPYDGSKGYRVVVKSWAQAHRIIELQNTKLGKLWCSFILTITGRKLKSLSVSES